MGRSSDRVETIVKIGGEGGSIEMEGRRRTGGPWQFRMVTNETALYELLGEEPPEPTEAPWVSSWDAALNLLDRYAWPRLHPMTVHPEFTAAILAAVAAHAEGGPLQVERWRELLAE